jgi:hypothetical protein
VKTTIEINGRKYDAQTGSLIVSDRAAVAVPNTATKPVLPTPVKRSPVIDGINRRLAPNHSFSRQMDATGESVKAQVKTAIKVPRDNGGIYSSQRQLEKSTTLLRNVVKKPFTKAQIHGLSGSMTILSKQLAQIRTQISNDITPKITTPKTVPTSSLINKFAPTGAQSTAHKPKIVNGLAVAQPPQSSTVTAPPLPPVIIPSHKNHKKVKQEVFKHTVIPRINFSSKDEHQDKLFTRVSKNLHFNSRVLAVSAGVLAIILLGGFLAYQRVPSVAMRVAASSAGFSGHLPSNIPSGYSYRGPIMFSKGVISLNYLSNSDQRRFTITQKPTSWTSESLLTNYLIASKARYQTYRDKGLTVFVFNEGNATWVDKGIWYSITGEGSLSSDQILGIAGSM